MTRGTQGETFDTVDWGGVDRSRSWFSAERTTALVGVAFLTVAFLYDYFVSHVYFVGELTLDPVDWVFLLGLLVVTAYGIVPVVKHRSATVRIARELRSHPAAFLATIYLVLFAILGLIGPAFASTPTLGFEQRYQPPLGFTAEVRGQCVGTIVGEGVERQCQGSLAHPLGTNLRGYPMEYILVNGARVSLYVVVFMAAFVVPVATIVGLVAGLRGGFVDDLLMGYVDVQLSIPAMLLYLIGYMYWNPSFLLMLVTFGLFSWGGIARLVRSEVLQRREDGYVLVARSLGASEGYVARRHILPNITNTVIPSVFQLFALLVLVEAGLAFLGFTELDLDSWGLSISESLHADVPNPLEFRDPPSAYQIWWESTIPAIALTLTVVSFKLAGDGLRDALDPRGD